MSVEVREANEQRTGGNRVLLAVGLLPAMVAAMTTVGDRAMPLIPSKRPAPLTFASRLYTHGDQPVEVTSVIQSEFRFRNDGDRPVRIENVQTSCDCMQPRLSQKVLQPGEIGSLVVPVETLLQSPGPQEYDLFLDYAHLNGDEPARHRVPLRIKAIIPDRTVVVQPKQLFISQHSQRPADFVVTINDYRDRPLTIRSVQSSNASVSGRLKTITRPLIQQVGHSSSDDTAEALTIEGSVAGDMAPGRHFFLLSVETDDPEFQVITVPVVVNGPAYPGPPEAAPSVTPRELHLVAAEHAPADRETPARMVIPADWDVSHLTTWPEQLQVRFDEPIPLTSGQQAVHLKVHLDGVPAAGITDGVVQLHANEGRDLLTLRVRFYRP